MLTIDCGNTRLKWGLFEGERLIESGALPLIELGMLARRLPSAAAAACGGVQRGRRTRRSGDARRPRRPGPTHPLGARQREQCGVRNGYTDPAQLGADRWAALIGARHLHRGPCLVVMAGTATTVDVLDGDGSFRGGLILPGFDLMRQSLTRNTAQLKDLPGAYAELPRNTADAIASGCLQAQLGAVERMFRPMAALSDAVCMVSGGAAQPLADRLDCPKRLEPHLVLHGLRCIGEAS